ncbi:MAG: glycosyltransferase family 2 protein [Ginsengibacter sp.]
MQLSIIIINYNVKYFLEQCLFSVKKALKDIDGEILVVDNSSDDGSFDFFQNRFSQVNFIWNDSNNGFAKANNQALKLAKGQYILFLNPDTIVPEDCFTKCISFIRSKKNNTALGIKMLNGSGAFLKESKRAFPSPVTSFFKVTGMAKLFPHSAIFAKYHLGNLDNNHNHPVDVLAGAFMMIPKKILDITGGFDEQFFMYGEDIDLSFRIQKAGFSNYYFAESTILHFKGESTKKGSLNYVKMFYKAMSIFAKKHYGGKSAGLFNFFIQMAIFMRAGLSATGKFLKFVTRIRIFKKKLAQFCIVGTEEEIEQAKKLLEIEENKRGKLHVICLDCNNKVNSIDILNRIENFRKPSDLLEIIFCEGKLSYKNILGIISQIKSPIHIHLYSTGSHAIISGRY